MTTDVYEKLAQHLDNLPAGFPRTKSGVEIRILRRLFSPEEAELTLHLSLIEEKAHVIARRAKISVKEAVRILEGMEKKGLVFVYHKDGKAPKYQATSYVIGIYEFQLNRLNSENVKDFEEYSPDWFDLDTWQKAPQLRTIPVGKSIDVQHDVLPYERAEELIRTEKRFAVAPCICRKEQQLLGEGCDRPLEACLVFGDAADYYVHNELGRKITREEVLEILKMANKKGLVLQPSNAKKPMSICTCCGCCCGVLKAFKRHPKPASIVASSFIAALDADLCNGCGVCETRCQMEAIHMDDSIAVLDPDRCIGCGLCVSTCPKKALTLERKPKSEQSHVPRTVTNTNIKLGRARGKLSIGKLVKIAVKSGVDRVLARR